MRVFGTNVPVHIYIHRNIPVLVTVGIIFQFGICIPKTNGFIAFSNKSFARAHSEIDGVGIKAYILMAVRIIIKGMIAMKKAELYIMAVNIQSRRLCPISVRMVLVTRPYKYCKIRLFLRNERSSCKFFFF